MSDYIDRQAYIAALNKVPAADVAPVAHGLWTEISGHIRLGNGERREWIKFWCSSCDASSNAPYNFCPHCGARMDGGSK